ncbi:MAG: 4-phosphopantoate--beta-alanine ligase [Candidatus Caldarchaeales archaeon]|nr:4-phosphopantoate--beta-alanine ligase [Candidatus Caldarchaeales archaeon]MDT7915004.1 4-phosphopantoate--beta-alanine ligase [Candidatus Caldarchaeales archaeon]
MEEIPRDHPRYVSLMIRRRLVEGFRAGIVVPEGLLAHGRGEALDYILGEETQPPAQQAVKAAAALMLSSQHPVISVNGNTVALAVDEVVRLSKLVPAKIEVNLFHRSGERISKIKQLLENHGAADVLGDDELVEIPGLSSLRRLVSRRGIFAADCVLVPLEDGDRAEKLVSMGKKIIAIDLNPFSRTSRAATITIVDNVVRAMPNLCRAVEELKGRDHETLQAIYKGFNNQENLARMIELILRRLERLAGLDGLKWGAA